MKEKFYRQCTLRSETLETVAWIEERGAHVGYMVTLEESDEPDRLWTVCTVSDTRLSHDQVHKNEHRHAHWK